MRVAAQSKKSRESPSALETKGNIYKRTVRRRSGPTCIDLFAGAGGLAEGFRQAGWRILAGADLDGFAGETFRKNFPEATFFEGLISDLSANRLLTDAKLKRGDLDCLIGGPPCQSFSYNNHQRSASDTRARLFRDYLHLLKAIWPKTLVMENVPGMLTIGDGAVVKEIKSSLGTLGYACEIRIMFAEDYGLPQQRRRLFIVASRVGPVAEIFPPGTHGPSEKPSAKVNPYVHRWENPSGRRRRRFTTVWQAIGDLPKLKSGGGKPRARYGSRAATVYQQQARRGSRLGLANHVCHRLTNEMLERIKTVPEGGNWRSIPRRLLPAGMRRARKSDHTRRYGRLARDELSCTVLTKCDPHWGSYVHPTQNRTISVREAARLQGFPDRFVFAGDFISKHYEQVGNAVPPPMAAALAAAVRLHIKVMKEKKVSVATPRRLRQSVSGSSLHSRQRAA